MGEVVEVEPHVTAVRVGDRIYGTWGHRTHHILDTEVAAQRILRAALDPILGIFSHLGSTGGWRWRRSWTRLTWWSRSRPSRTIAAQGLFLGEEFHHSRIDIICSQISGVAPELSYHCNRVRLAQTVMALQVNGRLNLRPLITHVAPFEQAAAVLEMLDRAPEEVVQAAIAFPGAQEV